MRIAMLSYHTCPLATLGGKDAGGMNVYVRDLSRYLGREGIHLDVFTRSQDEHVPHVLHDLGYGNRVAHIPAGPEDPLPKVQLVEHISTYAEHILSFARRKGLSYDLIHSHYWMSGVAGETLKGAWDVPLIQMFHTLGKIKQQVAQTEAEREGSYRIRGEEKAMALANRIVAATSTEKEQLQSLYQVDAEKISVIPPGVDLSRFYPIPPDEAREFVGVPEGTRMLLFVGRIEPLKGIETLLKALALIQSQRERQQKLCLAIIGGEVEGRSGDEDDELSYLQDLCQQYGLDNLVTFLGQQNQDDLPYYYSAAEMVIMPSHYESFGMVALESMACGTPVVASQVGGLAHLVDDGVTGYQVPVEDPQALSERITTLLQDKALRYRMGHDAFAFAKKFGWENITQQIIQLYGSVLSSHSDQQVSDEGQQVLVSSS